MKGADRRTAILRAALRLFAAKGFRGTTTRELAAAAGITEPVLYQHFRTKRALYTAIIEENVDAPSAHAAEFAALASTGDDRAFFTAVGRLLLERYERNPEVSRLLVNSCLEGHELAGILYDRLFAEFFKLVSGYIRRRIRTGAFRRVDPEIAARGLIGMFSHHGLLGVLFPESARPAGQRALEVLVTVFLAGITV